MSVPDFSMRQLLEAGVHFGHQTHRWNPKMRSYIFGERSGVHIIDLSQTVPMLHQALVKVRDVVAGGGRILFVGTKRQAQQPVAEAASRCAQYYMNNRWLGGTLTNWETVSKSIRRLRDLEETLEGEGRGLTKKEQLQLSREREKLDLSLGGIRDMGGLPDLMFVIDVKKEAIAIQEAKKLGIPVVAVVDTNCSPDGVDVVVPGNDDASRAIALYCNLVADAVIDGLGASAVAMGQDLGELEELPEDALLGADDAAEEPVAEGMVANAAAEEQLAEKLDEQAAEASR
ncbi:30S ribosomal protein S2 [Parvularcula dongshanensis]|uniref:Small ribosomal subunit protein uS2 n=1 Tax=Parvularcula dongshanensis TaxID=1173995 RepID=A0A840I3N9_9PROT|nr:30S ribosomal protein S2 [Parvularcula dongshanensis]MBB4658660.1 small subunit ribosomal protein S2 [Parvularcula dongshanensis]